MTINIDLPHPRELICYPGSIKILPDKIGGTNKKVFIMGRFNKLKMPVYYDSIMSSLEDKNHKVINRYGLLNPDSPGWPHPATYVIDLQGLVRWRFVETNYRARASNEQILQLLRKLP